MKCDGCEECDLQNGAGRKLSEGQQPETCVGRVEWSNPLYLEDATWRAARSCEEGHEALRQLRGLKMLLAGSGHKEDDTEGHMFIGRQVEMHVYLHTSMQTASRSSAIASAFLASKKP